MMYDVIQPGPDTGFEFGQQYEWIKLMENHKLRKLLKRDKSFVLCFIFSLDKYALL